MKSSIQVIDLYQKLKLVYDKPTGKYVQQRDKDEESPFRIIIKLFFHKSTKKTSGLGLRKQK